MSGKESKSTMSKRALIQIPNGISRMFQIAVTRRDNYKINALIIGGNLNRAGSAIELNPNSVYHMLPPKNKNGKFCVWVNSIMYLGHVLKQNVREIQWPHNDNASIVDYWRNRARRQLGSHIFMARSSQIDQVTMCIYKKKVHTFGAYPINSIYPIICYYWRPLPNPSYKAKTHETKKGTDIQSATLSLGLEFKKYVEGSANYEEGERYYSRKQLNKGNFFPISAGRVYELTEQRLQQLANMNLRKEERCFAIYVCSGAKLIVHDPYHKDQTILEHNRSLLQAGAVVVMEGKLRFTVPHSVPPSKQGEFMPKTKLSLKKAAGKLLNSDVSVEGVRNPVIFLGANESEYDSIAWNLCLIRGSVDTNNEPKMFLVIPDGGYINAIEEWNVGMPEVIARHQYECLHESSVSMKSIPNPIHCIDGFVAPTDDMLKRILGVDVNRSVQCDITALITTPTDTTDTDFLTAQELVTLTQIANPLPIQYNFQRWQEINPNRDRNSRPPVSPLYPLIYLDPLTPNSSNHWMPTNVYPGDQLKFVTDPVSGKVLSSDWYYLKQKYTRNQTHCKDNKYYYKLEKDWIDTSDEFEMSEISRISTQWLNHCNGISTRMGVNGRIYRKKANTQPIGEVISQYYYLYKNDWKTWIKKRHGWDFVESGTEEFSTPQEVFSDQSDEDSSEDQVENVE